MTQRYIHKQSTLALGLVRILISLTLYLLLIVAPAQAIDLAPVAIDGRQLFQVNSSEQFTAKERADLVNVRLHEVIVSQEPIKIAIEQRHQSPTILVNNRYLLTVTQADVSNGNTPAEQADVWVEQIRWALQQAQKERSAEFMRNALLLTVGVLLLVIALNWLLGRLWRRFRQAVLQRLPSSPEDGAVDSSSPTALDLLLNFTLLFARAGLWISVIIYITNLFPTSRIWSYLLTNNLIASFTTPILTLGQNKYSAIHLLILLGLLLGLVITAGVATNLLRTRILQVTGVSRGAQEVITVIVKYIIIIIGTLVLLQIWGVDLSSLTILASALGVGIGFGFQDIAKNFGSGLILLFERPIQVGDFVKVGQLEGTVERIGARSTLIRTIDYLSIIVPNSRFLEHEVINWNYENPVSGLRIPVGVAYGSDLSVVKASLLQATKQNSEVLSAPEPTVLFIGFGDSSLNFELRIWTNQPSKQYLIKSDLYFRIEELFRQYQIEIPFPQRDLHVRSGNQP